MSREEQIKEIIRCGKDCEYFLKNYAKIRHPTRGIIPFHTYPFQDECLEQFNEHRFNIVLKSRQLGLSTICAGYAAWDAIFHKDKSTLVIATKLDTAINFIKKVNTIITSIPKWLLLPKFEGSKKEIRFSNGSTIVAVPTSEDAGRSEGLSLLIVDEAAIIRNFKEIWTGLKPTISTGGKAILLSTPKGVGGQFYKLWVEAESGVNGFNPIRLPWTVHPEHDDNWFKNETKSLTKREIAQEFLCSFNASGDTFLQPDDIDDLRSAISIPLRKAGLDRCIWVWDEPAPGHQYIMSADIARGDSKDYSTFHIVDISDFTVVAEYKGKIPPDRFGDLLFEWATKYNTAFLCPENNSFGYTTCIKLKDLKYPRLYYSTARGDKFSYTPMYEDEIPGFTTSSKTRVQILTKFEELIRNKMLHSRSQRLFDELQTFVWNGARAESLKEANDDLIMSLAIACWLLDTTLERNEDEIKKAIAIMKASAVVKSESINIVKAEYGIKPKMTQTATIGNAMMQDLKWLL